MRILFTGASSFTGFWFVKEIAAAGHEVTAIFTKSLNEYDGIRAQRVGILPLEITKRENIRFGENEFLNLIHEDGPWDILCHHAADVTDYRSENFNTHQAVKNNTLNLQNVLSALATNGCNKVVLSGSVFENDEGAGSIELPAFSPYGLSKALTWQFFRYYVLKQQDMHLAKFVIPNPFGAYEEPRFTAYLMRCWFAGNAAQVNTPAYVRDNIHVDLLAKSYLNFLETRPEITGFSKINPSGYIESQGAFAQRVAKEAEVRLNIRCSLELKPQTEFSEPRVRINTDQLNTRQLEWNEAHAWDSIVDYYLKLLKG